jgi:transposase InsO family protein
MELMTDKKDSEENLALFGHSNKGKEYTSKEFEGFCKEEGIKRDLTVPYNP